MDAATTMARVVIATVMTAMATAVTAAVTVVEAMATTGLRVARPPRGAAMARSPLAARLRRPATTTTVAATTRRLCVGSVAICIH